MKRADIIDGVANLNKILAQSKLLDSLRLLRNHREENEKATFNFEELLISLNNYSIYYARLGEVEKYIIKVMGLEGLEDPKKWAQLIYDPEKTADLNHLTRNIENTLLFLPKVTDLIAKTYDRDQIAKHPDKEILGLLLPEQTGQFSSPERLTNALEAVSLFYRTFAEMQDLSSEDLSIVGMDSGRDKSFELLGTKSVIKEVRKLILAIWNSTLYYRERKFDERIDLVKQSLPVIHQLDEMREDATLGEEQAEIFKRNIHQGTTKFIAAGAIIAEMEKESWNDPRTLMIPEPKLLINNEQARANLGNPLPDSKPDLDKTDEDQAASVSAHASENNPKLLDNLDNLNEEDQELFKQLFHKMQGAKKEQGENQEDSFTTAHSEEEKKEINFLSEEEQHTDYEEKISKQEMGNNLWNLNNEDKYHN